QVEHIAHEDGVLVGRHAVLDDRPLPDGLQERGREATREAAVEKAETDGRLATVHARRREVDLAHRSPAPAGSGWLRGGERSRQVRAVVLRSICWTASLRRETVSVSTPSGSRYGERRSMTSATRPRKTEASATKNCGS